MALRQGRLRQPESRDDPGELRNIGTASKGFVHSAPPTATIVILAGRAAAASSA